MLEINSKGAGVIRPNGPRPPAPQRLLALFCPDVLGVHDAVGITLLGQEPLPFGGEVLVERVAGNQRVEACGPAVLLGPQEPAQALRLLLPGAEGTGNLDRDGGFREVDGEIRHLGHHQSLELALPEGIKEFLAGLDAGFALDQGSVQPFGNLIQLVDVLSNDQ